MADYLSRAASLRDFDPDDALSHAVRGDEFHVVVNRGIEGCPKYRIPLADLAELETHTCSGCGREFDSERGLTTHRRYCDEAADEEE